MRTKTRRAASIQSGDPAYLDLPVTVVPHGGGMQAVDMAIALLHGALEALKRDDRRDRHDLPRTCRQQQRIDDLMGELEELTSG